jgi:phenylacetate-CoA ligase
MDFSAEKLTRLKKAREMETQSRGTIDQYHRSQLPNTVAIAMKSPFWRERFKASGFDPARLKDPTDLYSAPAIAKADYFAALLKDPENYGGLLTDDLQSIRQRGAIIYHTSGTSGKQGRFINTLEDFNVFSAQGAELIRIAGGNPGDSVLIVFPLTFWAAGWGFCHGARLGSFCLLPAGAPADTAMRLNLIRQYRPKIVVSTPSYALVLGAAAREIGVDLAACGVGGLLLGGETFGKSKRDRIETLWGLPGGTRNFYGISEGGPLFAVECEAQDGLHLFEGDTIHQFWRPGLGEPAAPGELAEHVFTSISQSTMVTWFNFRTRDGAFYSDEPCSCGRHTRRMWIAERLDDMVKVKGVNIFASGVEELLAEVKGIGPEFRLVVDQVARRDVLTLQVEPLDQAEHLALVENIKRKMLDAWNMNFEIECVPAGTLPRTELKARRWLDKRPKD